MYDSFAQIYDSLMEDVPYEAWCGYLAKVLAREGIDSGLVLDLGCGTGTLTTLLKERGYDMIGVDSSPAMLQAAAEKESGGILWLLQDMRSFELYGTVRAIVCVCDCMNYMLREEDLLRVFSLANNYLDPGGLFLFDMNTAYKYREVLGDRTFAQSLPECAYIWENSWFEEEKINQYDLTLFIREDTPGSGMRELYGRYDELHIQRAWEIREIRDLIRKAGMEFVFAEEAYTGKGVARDTERILFAAREHGKAKNSD